jgi:hypothetical protein
VLPKDDAFHDKLIALACFDRQLIAEVIDGDEPDARHATMGST